MLVLFLQKERGELDPAPMVPTALYSTCVLLTFFVFFKPFQTSSVTVNKAVIGLETSHFCLTHSPHRNDAMVSEKHVTQSIGQQMLLLFTDQNITIKKLYSHFLTFPACF